MRSRRGRGRAGRDWALFFILAVTSAGCYGPAPTPHTSSSAILPANTPELTAAELDVAKRFRDTFGLRSDEMWIRSVAADPASEEGRADFGVPLLAFERTDLLTRPDDPVLAHQIEQYGLVFPDDWAGVFYDQQTGGTLVAAFSRNVERHRTALDQLLPANARVEIRAVDWSHDELAAFARLVEADKGWFSQIGTQFYAVDVSALDVRVRYYGDPAAAQLIAEHFGEPGWLTIKRMGPLPWQGALGDLLVHLEDARGTSLPQLYCYAFVEDTSVDAGNPYAISDENGQCLFKKLPAVTYRVTVERHEGRATPVAARGPILVAPGTATLVKIVVD